MLTVYPESIIYLIEPLGGLAEEGYDLDVRLRPEIPTEEVLKQIYETELKPHYLRLDPALQRVCKIALQYALNTHDFNYRNEFNSHLLPFDCPEDEPRKAFLWLWQVLFPNEAPLPLTEPFEIDRRPNVARYVFMDINHLILQRFEICVHCENF